MRPISSLNVFFIRVSFSFKNGANIIKTGFIYIFRENESVALVELNTARNSRPFLKQILSFSFSVGQTFAKK